MKEQLDVIAHVIQLSVAPVFLLTGIAGLLGVLSNRLGRIVDRARALEALLNGADTASQGALHGQLRTLARRASMVYRAIALCVIAALLVCAVIVGLFVTAYYGWWPNLTRGVGALFALALLALIAGLLLFLREVYVATASLRIGSK
jgi:hypothetical protein